ncbi:MAG: cytochrome c oxidase cbb3-type subunit I/II [Myxococcota bacterium]|jgi:cytochrome c oxidase cbb3-type subunit I/II
MSQNNTEHWHRRYIESDGAKMAIFTTIAISIGGLIEIVPMYNLDTGPESMAGIEPYTPLELAGRDIYVSEGCYNCHSQMIRPFRSETLRYGEWSRAGEYAYDHPFQLGSRRIGPDLQRVGGKYPDAWHFEHMRDPRATSPGSIMPAYSWLHEYTYNVSDIHSTVKAMVTLGVPYDAQAASLDGVTASVESQATGIVARLAESGIETAPDRQIVAVIAYLQRLGVDGRASIEAASTDAGADAPSGGVL